MIKAEQLNKLKAQFGHAFDVDNKGNITLKERFGIPQFKLIYVKGGNFKNYKGKEIQLSGFYIAVFQTTQELYQAVTGKKPSRFEGINHPVEQVTWYDTVEFCRGLNKKIGFNPISEKFETKDSSGNKIFDYNFLDGLGNKTGDLTRVKGFRLPTETEWEYAARGGHYINRTGFEKLSGLEYAGSNNIDDVAWYKENNAYETKPVGLKLPNQLEIYDMSGNVFEWCWDWYDIKFYEKSAGGNPVNTKNGSSRVLRGGSWDFNAVFSRMADRYYDMPDNYWDYFGFRFVLFL